MLRYGILVGILMCLSSGSALAMAKEGCGGDCISCHTLTEKEANTLLDGLGTVKSVKPAPVRGLYELRLEKDGNKTTAYVDYGKKNIIAGQIFDIASREPVTPKPTKSVPTGKVDMASIPMGNSLLMGNAKGAKKLFVFTDPDCPLCGKLHGELKKVVEMDNKITIYIKMLPLKIHQNAYEKARVILGRKSLALLEKAFSGEKLPVTRQQDSAKAVDESIKFAESIGIISTPTLVLPDGMIVSGFKDAASILSQLNEK